jgi:ribosomal protein L37E
MISMNKIIIKCANCGEKDNWIQDENFQDKNRKVCGNCGAICCAKNRIYEWVD